MPLLKHMDGIAAIEQTSAASHQRAKDTGKMNAVRCVALLDEGDLRPWM
jgi:hypothetical protein